MCGHVRVRSHAINWQAWNSIVYFFIFSDLQNLAKCMDSMVPYYSLLNMKVIWLYMVSAPLPLQWGDLIWKFAKILWWQNFFLHLWQDKPLWVELKTNGGVIFITILLHFHYLISLETGNTQKMWMHRLLLADILKFTISVLEHNFY